MELSPMSVEDLEMLVQDQPESTLINHEYIFLRPSDIRFTRQFIAPELRSGILIQDAVDGILNKEFEPEKFGTLKVFKLNGNWYTWYNQRLYLNRLLEREGFLNFVPVQWVHPISKGCKDFTSINDGIVVEFREGQTLSHGPINGSKSDSSEKEEEEIIEDGHEENENEGEDEQVMKVQEELKKEISALETRTVDVAAQTEYQPLRSDVWELENFSNSLDILNPFILIALFFVLLGWYLF
ncbi:unnamed protein product [Clavelina lepadiformis]|uniref:Uncharacterized protein n=1 Tax=Clavelina lepadiformis TaxID=159417 RepID=A0ABP0G5Q7_CLALP